MIAKEKTLIRGRPLQMKQFDMKLTRENAVRRAKLAKLVIYNRVLPLEIFQGRHDFVQRNWRQEDDEENQKSYRTF